MWLGLAMICICLSFSTVSIACDIAVVSAKVTSNGRPLIWKNRDHPMGWEQEVASYERRGNTVNRQAGGSVRVIDRTGDYPIQSGSVNEAGFAICNTSVYQQSLLHEVFSNADVGIMTNAIKRCVTMADFDDYLAEWHTIKSNQTSILSGNFAVIDAHGGAALYELSTGDYQTDIYAYGGRVKIHKIDVNTGFVTNEDGELIGNNGQIGVIDDFVRGTTTQVMDGNRQIIPSGYRFSNDRTTIVDESGVTVDDGNNFCGIANRTNSSFWVQLNDDTPREDRATDMMLEMLDENRLSFRSVLQEVARDTAIEKYLLDTYPNLSNLDPGTETQQSTFHTISRYCTNVAFVVDGVAPGENPALATLWVNLGDPAVGTATPYFAAANDVPSLAWADARFFRIPMDRSPTCYINRAITDRRDELYENNGDPNALNRLPPPGITTVLLFEMVLTNWGQFDSKEERWSQFEALLSEWYMAYMTHIDEKDAADKTVDLPGLQEIQTWTLPLEDIILDNASGYLEAMRHDPEKISQYNLKRLADYCSHFMYDNYIKGSAHAKAWDFADPWRQ
jgi:hypothetical protein